jgi:bacterioferritin-associated ferredoxin
MAASTPECAMYVCICNAVTDRQIREAAASGARTFSDVRRRTGCSDCCGSCESLAIEIFDKAVATRTLDLPILAIAA